MVGQEDFDHLWASNQVNSFLIHRKHAVGTHQKHIWETLVMSTKIYVFVEK